MNRKLIILGLVVALGACSSPSKTTEEVAEEPTMEAVVDTVEAVVDSMAVEMDTVMAEVDSVMAE
ncbi:MAG: hypothetical protein ABJN36_00865 [Cyclobacteriaceae bacterium]